VDYFVEHWPDTEKMSVEQLESLKDNLRELSGQLFLPEVVDELLKMKKKKKEKKKRRKSRPFWIKRGRRW
jgi:hypothetical protein